MSKILLVIVGLAAFVSLAAGQDANKSTCGLRSGLTHWDVKDTALRNYGCTLDCIMEQGTVLTFDNHEGLSCPWAGAPEDHKCQWGRCLHRDIKEHHNGDYYYYRIFILSAKVPDNDPLPGQGESDTFVIIKVTERGDPLYKDGQILCYTYVVQDNPKPKWAFECRPGPLKLSAMLQFVVVDSDTPAVFPDQQGSVEASLGQLAGKTRKLTLKVPSPAKRGDYYVEVKVEAYNKHKN